jgi:OmpA-OmpF porin, OOP family
MVRPEIDMADSIFQSLVKMLDSRDLRATAEVLGEPEHSVSRGMQSSIAAVMGVLAGKVDYPGALRIMLDHLPGESANITSLNLLESVLQPESPLTATGNRLLSSLFGPSGSTVVNSIAHDSGLRQGTASILMAAAARFVLGYINRRVREERLTMSALGTILRRDTPAIRNALPSGLTDIIWPAPISDAEVSSPGAPAEATAERRPGNQLAPVALAALALAGFWMLNQARRAATVQNYESGTGETTEGLLQSPAGTASRVATIESTGLVYRTGSADLLPEARRSLESLADQLAASPNTHANVAGYTDDTGNKDRNLLLSQKRADKVAAFLVGKGVARARLSAHGYGEDSPIADNSTAEGRAKNRRVVVIVE